MKFSYLLTLRSCLIVVYFDQSNSIQYIGSQADCTKDTLIVSNNIGSRQQCAAICLVEECFFIEYTGSTCSRKGHNPYVYNNGRLSWDTYKKFVWKNIAGPDIPVTMSSTFPTAVASNLMDGDYDTVVGTNNENDPWLFIDLKQNYYLQQLNFYLRSAYSDRWQSIMVRFSATSVAPAQYPTLPYYGNYAGPPSTPISSYNITSLTTPGPCGRYLLVQRVGALVYLEVNEMDIFVL